MGRKGRKVKRKKRTLYENRLVFPSTSASASFSPSFPSTSTTTTAPAVPASSLFHPPAKVSSYQRQIPFSFGFQSLFFRQKLSSPAIRHTPVMSSNDGPRRSGSAGGIRGGGGVGGGGRYSGRGRWQLHPHNHLGAADGRVPNESYRGRDGMSHGWGKTPHKISGGGFSNSSNLRRKPVYEYRQKKPEDDMGSNIESLQQEEKDSQSTGNGSKPLDCVEPSDSMSVCYASLSPSHSDGQNTCLNRTRNLSRKPLHDELNGITSQLDHCSELDSVPVENDPTVASGAKVQPSEVTSSGDSTNSEEMIVSKPFDICLSKTGTPIMLKPSLLVMNREMRRANRCATEGHNGNILRSGMVLLENYLSMHDQVKIVKLCRDLGLGPGGFYQPGYRDGGKLQLKMMCLGKNWDPDRSEYGEHRPFDGALPPKIPHVFHQIVEKAIEDSHGLIQKSSKVTRVEDILPLMSPDICLVNFYSASGRLGLHQDKDESEESLCKGLPVVSFSIGDEAEFLYSDERDAEKAEKVVLKSGDVLIFGGKSRHIFHGVQSIKPKTAPKALLEETNIRPGRLNLTFRQY